MAFSTLQCQSILQSLKSKHNFVSIKINMKSQLKLTLATYTIIICSAFINTKNIGVSGTYGVSEKDPSQIELELNKDYSFTYQDFSIPSQKIKVQGTYEVKKSKILLMAKDQQIEFHNKWKISGDGITVKSRKGLTFYTLQKK